MSQNPISAQEQKFFQEYTNSGLSENTIRCFRDTIYTYFTTNGRLELPWRKTDNPYHILVSEIMLQQTQVDRVKQKYERFIAAMPDITALAGAPLADVLRLWQGLGYNRRALALHKAAKIIVNEYGGIIPENPEELVTLPGIGQTTAGEIAAFAFNRQTVFIETNIRTVYIYFFFRNRDGIHDNDILPCVEKTLDRENPRRWYYALMDYGVLLKKARSDPGRKSIHYRKQSPFKGSDREIRGQIIRLLTPGTILSESKILSIIDREPERVRTILSGLRDEGFIVKAGRNYRIAE
ncbi:A/G-specific adenine glycosylase [candidate division KSB1 bacterium]